MRLSPTRTLPIAAALLACACTPAIGAVGDVTTFPTPIPGNGAPVSVTTGPDGALWFAALYWSDPGIASTARAKPRVRREMGDAPPCCSRLIRVAMDGSVSPRGRDPFGTRVINGLTTFAGDLWVAATDNLITGPSRIWRYSTAGATTAFESLPAASDPIPGPDGNLWYTSLFASIGRTSASGAGLPPLPISTGSAFAGGASAAWTFAGSNIRRISADGSVNDFPVPASGGELAPAQDGSVWFGESSDAVIGRLVPGSGAQATFGDGALAPGGVAVSPDGTGWFTDLNAGRVVRADPSLSLQYISVPGATATTLPALGPDGNLWFTFSKTSGERFFARVLTGTVPVSTRAPEASGKVKPGLAITVDNGQWNYAPTAYTHAWQRCNGTDGATCTDIPGATSASYSVTADDVGRGLRARVVATNLNGASVPVTSNIVTNDSPPSNSISLGTARRKKYVLTLQVRVPGPGVLRLIGTVPGQAASRKKARELARKPKPIRACAPKPVTMAAEGRRVMTCTLSSRARSLLATKARVVTLAVTFSPTGGTGATKSVRVKVPRIAPKKR
ncbi:MAG: hypothetical protein ACKORG_07360 [Actinomycetota bacterium]